MIIVLSSSMMRAADADTIADGISSTELMRRAAESVYSEINSKGRIAIVAGLGNNGGDGFALAEILLDNGVKPDVYFFRGNMSADAAFYYNRITGKGIEVRFFDESISLKGYDVIVDCIFGTGGNRKIEGLYEKAVRKINESGAYIIAMDIPSGLNSDSGRVMGVAVKADLTVSIGAYKTGHFLNDGMDYTGKLVNYDIGINCDKGYYLIEEKDLEPLFPKRKRNVNKGSSGRLVIIGGSDCYMGALMLAESGAAALKTGAGLNTLVIPRSYHKEMLVRITESTLFPMPDEEGFLLYDKDLLDNALKGADAAALGMGMGKNRENIKYLRHLLDTDIPLIIDADGLNALSEDTEILRNCKAKVVLTPHPKEFARLTCLEVEEILNNPIEIAFDFAKKYGVVLLLKGAASIITDGESVYINPYGAPCMAKGGSGDVLSGIIGGLLARGIPPLKAAWGGACIAGRAGELARDVEGEYSASPRNTVEHINKVIMSAANREESK